MEKQRIEETLRHVLSRVTAPGAAIAVSLRGEVYEAFKGSAIVDEAKPVSSYSAFPITCLMKFLISVLVLRRVCSGRITLDDRIIDYLPELSAARSRASADIRIKHLLSHTAGYRGLDIQDAAVRWGLTWEKFVEYMQFSDQHFAPGTLFNYEHSGHVMLGEILHRITRVEPEELVADEIFQPLGIEFRATWRQAEGKIGAHQYDTKKDRFDRIVPPGIGNFWRASLSQATLTAREMCRLGAALMALPLGNDRKEISPELNPFVPIAKVPLGFYGQNTEVCPLFYGYCCGHYPLGLVGINGSAVGSACSLRMFPKENMCVALAMNAWLPAQRDRVVAETFKSLLGIRPGGGIAGPAKARWPADLAIDDVVGRYEGSLFGYIDIEKKAGTLRGYAGKRKVDLFTIIFDEGRIQVQSQFAAPIGIFVNPEDSNPCMILGVHTYAKV